MRSPAGGSTEPALRICLIIEIFHPEDQGGQGRQAFALARGIRTALLLRADAVVAISTEIATALAKRLGSSRRVVHIPNGIDMKHWSSPSHDKEELRRRLGLPQGVLCTYTGSDSEGFALSLIEAMAMGLPCISTAVGAAPEVLQHGLNGWLVPIRDAQGLHAALEEALSNPERWSAMGAAAQRDAMARFDLDEVTARYVQLFESLLPANFHGSCAKALKRCF